MRERLHYIDNLRTLMIILVIIQHLLCVYNRTGLLIRPEVDQLAAPANDIFGFFMGFQQAYFMGILFWAAGYFISNSYDRRGFGKFIQERFVRLYVPALITMTLISPFTQMVLLGIEWPDLSGGFLPLLEKIYLGKSVMWFTENLFFFSLLYALARLLFGKAARSADPAADPSARSAGSVSAVTPNSAPARLKVPLFWCELALILLIAVFAFLLRLRFSTEARWLGFKIGNLSSYTLLFLVGIAAHRYKLLNLIKKWHGRLWLAAGIVLGNIGEIAMYAIGGSDKIGIQPFQGGLTYQSAAYSLWESFVAVAMTVGLLSVFRELLNRKTPFLKMLSDNSFGVFMFHIPIVFAATILFYPVPLSATAKFFLLTAVCIPVSFLASHFVFRKIPLLKKVL